LLKKNIFLSAATLAVLSLAGFASADSLSLSGTLKDTNSGSSYNVTISPAGTTPPPPVVTPPPVVEPPVASGTIPLSYTDARFNKNAVASSTTVPGGGTIANKTITDTGSIASIVTRDGGATIKNVRIKSREGVRIGGGGTFVIEDSYIEVNGTGEDHADGIQTYSPGDKGVLRVRNTLIKCGVDQATAGLFIADNWTGGLELENVVFQGGPFGLRAHSDRGGDLHVSLKNVSFVGPFGYRPFLLSSENGTKLIIDRWENVSEATIVNGALVKGKAIPKPF
jgi:hypothetical protein